MHELGITQGIVERARAAAVEAGAAGVCTLYVSMTPAADFTRESIEMYFEMLAGEDELFREATLVFEEGSAAAMCLSCAHGFMAAGERPACPECGSTQLRYDPHAPMIQLTGMDVDEGDDEEAERSGGA